MKSDHQRRGAYVLSVGLAMFSMFFGAGNVVFPIIVGLHAHGYVVPAIIGLFLTAVGVPFLGLYAMTYFDGEYRPFFDRTGKGVGFFILVLLMGLIGPFGALPRCIALSYSTCSLFMPSLSSAAFSLAAVVLLYVCAVKKSKIVDIVGVWLTPVLLFALFVIILMGVLSESPLSELPKIDSWGAFVTGLMSGYHTMDLIGSFFFCHFIVNALKKISIKNDHICSKELTKNTLLASSIGALLLALVYGGLTYIVSKHSHVLEGVSADKALAVLSYHFLGSYGGVATCVAVILACLTTAIALTATFSEFIYKDLFESRLSYKTGLVATLIISFFVSILEFQGIFKMLAPLVQTIYPSLIVLSVLNIAHRVYNIPIGTRGTFCITFLTAVVTVLL